MTRKSTRRVAAMVSGFLLVGTATVATVGAASATTPAGTGGDVCVPADAWTEVIPAQGTPTITVENPSYVPEVPAWVDYITTEVTTYQKYQWTGESKPEVGPGENSKHWVAVGSPVSDRPESVGRIVKEAKGYVYWMSITEVVTEEVHHEAVPADGEPTMEIPNPDYIPERVIEHSAVVCTVPGGGKTEVNVEANAEANAEANNTTIVEQVAPAAKAPAASAPAASAPSTSSTSSTSTVHVNG